MKLLQALIHAGRFSVQPTYSLFHTNSQGIGEPCLLSHDAQAIVDKFKEQALLPSTFGMEVRCNGVRVEFTGT